MNEKVEGLLEQLRDAIHEAIADSWSVAQVMAELEKECCSPTFWVDVALAEPTPSEAFVFTDFDRQFLQAIRVTNFA